MNAPDEGRRVSGRTPGEVVDEHVPVRESHGHESQNLFARVADGHEECRALRVSHPVVRFKHVRRSGGEVESVLGELHGVRSDNLNHVIECFSAIAFHLTNSFGEPIAGVREIGARVVSREQRRGTDPTGGRRGTPREPLGVVGMLLGAVGTEGHPETPSRDPGSCRYEDRSFEL
ncbi:MAG: hypothetical protein ACR2KQ_09345 [Actinomycetota bacterium]